MQKQTIVNIILIIAIVGVLGFTAAHIIMTQNPPPAIITGMSVDKPNIVVTGEHLSRVEVWAIPTGTNVTENDYIKLGDATLAGKPGANETWTMPIPRDPVLATEIIAKGFNKDENEIGRTSLPYVGATAINAALWDGK